MQLSSSHLSSPSTPWHAYTDGGCRPSNPGPAAWGAVLIEPDGITTHRRRGFLGHGTNQIAELSAATHGLRLIPLGAHVTLTSDSQYVLKGISEWRKGWTAKGFKTSGGGPVANLDYWKALWAEVDLRKVTTNWVKGHAGNKYNEEADFLVGLAQEEALEIAGTAR